MGAELAVLGGDRRADHVAVDPLEAHPVAGEVPAAEAVAEHGEGEGRVGEAVEQNPQDAGEDEEEQARNGPSQDSTEPAAFAGPYARHNHVIPHVIRDP